MVDNPNIEVIMSTYNGVDYIHQQIESIYFQTLRPSRLLVRDDGSNDGSIELILNLKEIYGSWLHLVQVGSNLGCTSSFDLLLTYTDAPYVAFADQDDIWLPNKLHVCYMKLKALEIINGPSLPLLIHSNLVLVDDSLNSLGITYVERQHLDPYKTLPSEICLTNVVTGCTALFNRALIGQACPIPPEALLHDWWFALVASSFGEIGYIPEPLILYRQHSNNVIGASGLGFHYWISRLISFIVNPSSGGHTISAIHQILAFKNRYGSMISSLPLLLFLRRPSRLIMLYKLRKSGLPSKHGFLRTIALYIWLFRRP